MQRAFIIGCGYTGTALAQRLLTAKIEVLGTRSQRSADAPFPILEVDLFSDGRLDFSRARHAVVYYMVSTLVREYDLVQMRHLQLMDTALAGLEGQSIRGLIYLSSTSVYGDHHGGWVDEETPTSPTSPWGRMRVDLEQRIAHYGRKWKVPTGVVRLPEIYGPHRGPAHRLRQGYQLRYPQRYSNRIYLTDLVDVLFELGSRLDQELLVVSDSCPATALDVYLYAAQCVGLSHVPLADTDAHTDANRLALLRDSKRCSNLRLLAWLGRPLKYPSYREGILASLASD